MALAIVVLFLIAFLLCFCFCFVFFVGGGDLFLSGFVCCFFPNIWVICVKYDFKLNTNTSIYSNSHSYNMNAYLQ